MIIRNAQTADRKEVFYLAKKFASSFDLIEENFNQVFDNLMSNPHITFIVAEENNQVVGYCLTFHHETFFANGLVSWVEEITVDENLRGNNIGSELMQKIEELSREKGSKLIALATRRAANFYKKNNYEESAVYFRKLL